MNSDNAVSAKSVFNAFFGVGTRNMDPVVPARAGDYVPTRLNCYSQTNDGNYKRTYQKDYDILPVAFTPITVVDGEITELETLSIGRSGRADAVTIAEVS